MQKETDKKFGCCEASNKRRSDRECLVGTTVHTVWYSEYGVLVLILVFVVRYYVVEYSTRVQVQYSIVWRRGVERRAVSIQVQYKKYSTCTIPTEK
jgi:hypothetical protein